MISDTQLRAILLANGASPGVEQMAEARDLANRPPGPISYYGGWLGYEAPAIKQAIDAANAAVDAATPPNRARLWIGGLVVAAVAVWFLFPRVRRMFR